MRGEMADWAMVMEIAVRRSEVQHSTVKGPLEHQV